MLNCETGVTIPGPKYMKDLIKKYPDLEDKIKELSEKDPSKKNKYLEWGVKQVLEGHRLQDIIPTLEIFEKFSSKFKHRDIYRYTITELEEEAKNLSTQGKLVSKTEQKQKAKATGAKKIYEDKNLLLLRIDSKQACVTYGKETKWCITMEGTSYWEEYRGKDVIFYFLFTKEDSEKYAIAVAREGKKISGYEIYDAEDKLIKTTPYWSTIRPYIERDAPTAPNKIVQAKNPNTTPQVLKELAKDEDDTVRRGVAKNPNTPPQLLKELAGDKDDDVRWGVAQNPNTPPQLLKELARDEDDYVRRAVARNPSTPPQALKELARDADEYVRYWVANNPNTPPQVLKELAKDNDGDVRYWVSKNHNTPPQVLKELARDKYYGVRKEVAKNPSTPPQVLKKLARLGFTIGLILR